MQSTLPLNILYVHYPSDLYGAGRSLLRLTSSLDKNRFHPIVILSQRGLLKNRLEANGVRVIICKSLCVIERRTFKSSRIILLIPTLIVSIIMIYYIIKRYKVDIVHTNTGIIISSGITAKLAKVPHVWHIRDWFGEYSSLWKIYSKYILWSSKIIICVSRAIAEQFPHDPKVKILHNGFSLDEFNIDKYKAAQEFKKTHKLNDKFIVGTVGRIKFIRKGQEVLVRAGYLLKEKGYRFKYIIIGSVFKGNEEHLSRLDTLINELNMKDDVKIIGELEDVKPAYASMDVFVLPSVQPEPFGGVVMEAMSMGLPVIGTNIGGTVDQIVDGETGFLIPPNDPVSLSERIERLYKSPLMRKKFSKAAIEHMRTKFDIQRTIKVIENIYTKNEEVS